MDYSGQTETVGCGTAGHDDTCLCDVSVPSPVKIHSDSLRYMWHIGRAAEQIGWSIGDNPLDLLVAVTEAHDFAMEVMAWKAAVDAAAEVEDKSDPYANPAAALHAPELSEARRRAMETVSIHHVPREREKAAAAFVACNGDTDAALVELGWDWETFTLRTHLYANGFRQWTPAICTAYINARLAGTRRTALRAEFGLRDENISSIDTCVGMGELSIMRDAPLPKPGSSQPPLPAEIREFCVQGRRNGIGVADLTRLCHEKFGQAPSRPTIYKWEARDIEARNQEEEAAA